MLGLGRSSMRVMPSVASGRYSPGPGTVELLGEGISQEIRPAVANCSPEWPDFLAIVSIFSGCNSRPATQSLQPVAIGAAVEATNRRSLRCKGSPQAIP